MMMTDNGISKEMPKYKSHKEVWALKIRGIERGNGDSTILLFNEGFASINVDKEYADKIKPTLDKNDLGYYVVYKDGYKSWSPSEAFEEGYSRI